MRFEAAIEGLRPPEFASILDVGCGFGGMLHFLRARGWRGYYHGVDLVPELIEEARSRHRADDAATFECRDIETDPPADKRSMAVAIGIFNHRLDEHQAHVESMVRSMWTASTSVVICDFLSTSSDLDRRRPDLFYADPAETFALGRRFTRRLAIAHSYMPFEFQLKIWHDDTFSQAEPVFPPYADLART